MNAEHPIPSLRDPIPIDGLILPLLLRWKLIVLGSLATGVTALAITFLIAPTYTARLTLMPPQQPQSMATAALASLGSLAGLAGNAAGLRNPVDQYVALLQSQTIADRLIESFQLKRVYDVELLTEARLRLSERIRISAGKRDGIITIEADDTDPKRAADLANAHVLELRKLTTSLALTEAQQRRQFFEGHLKAAKSDLLEAQQQLQSSGFNGNALRAEPKAQADIYARLKAELTASEVRLQALKSNLADGTPEVIRQQSTVSALRSKLAGYARNEAESADSPDYIARYREFKYRETLFELFARQYEVARVDESREGAILQIVDPALVPERKSRPKRVVTAIAATTISFIVLAAWALARHRWLLGMNDPDVVARRRQRRDALAGRL